MTCSSSCSNPGSHRSWGECVRSKSLQIADVTAHKFNQGVNAELNAYVDARRAGLQPNSTRMKDVKAAWKATDLMGVPYRGDA